MKKYENVKIEKLVPYRKNARIHSKEQIEKIAKSIKEFGFINPVLIDSNFGIIAGHGRVLAAKKLKIEEVPCLFIEHLTEIQKRSYIIADNKLGLDSEWDENILKLELLDLKDLEFDISLTGFEIEDLNFDCYVAMTSENNSGAIAEKYLIAPFSVIYSDSPKWIARKKFLTEHLKIKSDIGREHVVTYSISPDKYKKGITGAANNSVSVFDPVLCEILYNWFCKKQVKFLTHSQEEVSEG